MLIGGGYSVLQKSSQISNLDNFSCVSVGTVISLDKVKFILICRSDRQSFIEWSLDNQKKGEK